MGGFIIWAGLNLDMGASDFDAILGVGVFEGYLIEQPWGTIFE